MPDFRDKLYERYVSTFKGIEEPGPATLRSNEDWARRRILPLLSDVDPGAPVLELGCGQGEMLALLRSEGFESVHGVDISSEQVARAVARGLDVRTGEARQVLAAARSRFAAILAFDFFEHFTKDELLEILPLVHDALRPGGTLLLRTPNGDGLFPNQVVHGDLTHLTIFNEGSMGQVLRLHGFVDVECRETGPVPGNLVGWLRTLAWSVIRSLANLVRRIETGKTQRIWTENLICRARRGDKEVS